LGNRGDSALEFVAVWCFRTVTHRSNSSNNRFESRPLLGTTFSSKNWIFCLRSVATRAGSLNACISTMSSLSLESRPRLGITFGYHFFWAIFWTASLQLALSELHQITKQMPPDHERLVKSRSVWRLARISWFCDAETQHPPLTPQAAKYALAIPFQGHFQRIILASVQNQWRTALACDRL
jgi:hypothetical protein